MDDVSQFDYAVEFAKIEYSSGYRATYCVRYFLNNHNFFSSSVIDRCKALVDLGHDLNLHLDVVKLYREGTQTITELIEKPLTFLRKNGIEVCGVSAHGSPENYKSDYGLNYEFWKEFDPQKNEGIAEVPFDRVSLADFNLSYEAYFLGYDAYLTDSMGKWTGILLKEWSMTPYENTMINSDKNIGKGVVDRFNLLDRGFLQINIHPVPHRWKRGKK